MVTFDLFAYAAGELEPKPEPEPVDVRPYCAGTCGARTVIGISNGRVPNVPWCGDAPCRDAAWRRVLELAEAQKQT